MSYENNTAWKNILMNTDRFKRFCDWKPLVNMRTGIENMIRGERDED